MIPFSAWDWSLIPEICATYWKVFALVIVAVVFVVYQFITADLQAFIYFQF